MASPLAQGRALLALDPAALAETYDRASDRQLAAGQQLLEDLDIGPGQRLLDVGCGTGRLAAHAASVLGETGEVIGIDPLPTRITVARRRSRPNCRFLVGRGEDLSRFGDESFDIVYMNDVFHWLPDQREVLREVRRVLRPSGRVGLCAAVKDRPHELETILRAVSSIEFGDPSIAPGVAPHQITSAELRSLLAEVGFTHVALELRTLRDHFQQAEDVILACRAGSFGSLFAELTPSQKSRVDVVLARELESRRSPLGFVLERYLTFAVATKGGDHARLDQPTLSA